MSNEREDSINGFLVESWYNESACNWEAFIMGYGSSTSVHNREEAIENVMTRFNLKN